MRNYWILLMFFASFFLGCSGPTVQDLVASENVDALVARVKAGKDESVKAAEGLMKLGKETALVSALKDMSEDKRRPILAALVPRLEKELASPSAPVAMKDFGVEVLSMLDQKDAAKVAKAVLDWFLADPETRSSLGIAQFPAVIESLWPHLSKRDRKRAMDGVARWIITRPEERSSFGMVYYNSAHPKKGKPTPAARERYEIFRKRLLVRLLKTISPSLPKARLRTLATLFYAYANEKEKKVLGARLLKEMKAKMKLASAVPVGLLGDLKPKGGVKFLEKLLNPKNPLEIQVAAVRALGAYTDSPEATSALVRIALPALQVLSHGKVPQSRDLKLAYEAASWFSVSRQCGQSREGLKTATRLMRTRLPDPLRNVGGDLMPVVYGIVVCAKGERGMKDVLKHLGTAPSLQSLLVLSAAVSGLPKEQRSPIVKRLLGSKRAVEAALGILVMKMRPNDVDAVLLEPLKEDSRRVEGWNMTIGQLARQVLESASKKEGQ